MCDGTDGSSLQTAVVGASRSVGVVSDTVDGFTQTVTYGKPAWTAYNGDRVGGLWRWTDEAPEVLKSKTHPSTVRGISGYLKNASGAVSVAVVGYDTVTSVSEADGARAKTDAGLDAVGGGGASIAGGGAGASLGLAASPACGPGIVVCAPLFVVAGGVSGAIVGEEAFDQTAERVRSDFPAGASRVCSWFVPGDC